MWFGGWGLDTFLAFRVLYALKGGGGETAQLVERPIEKPGTILTRVRVPRAARYFSPRVSFSYGCPYNRCVQWHASTSVCTLKIPSTGSYTIVWTHENTEHTDKDG